VLELVPEELIVVAAVVKPEVARIAGFGFQGIYPKLWVAPGAEVTTVADMS
jgi:hypothetical protein